MKKLREALIAHINNSDVPFEAVKKHEGEASDPRKITAPVPGCYVMFTRGDPAEDDGRVEFDCLIITESASFLPSKEDDALSYVGDLAQYFLENPSFNYEGDTFYISNSFPTENIWPGDKNTILAMSVTIYQGT